MSTVQRYCVKCRKTMNEVNFYSLKDGTKSEMCKVCETMHIDNYDPETFLWLLEKYDVPYIPSEWNVLRDRAYAKDPYKMNGMSVIGRYISKMKLKQWKNFHYADSELLQQEAEEKAKLYGQPQAITEQKIEQMRAAYENGEISEAQFKTYTEIQEPREPVFVSQDGAVTTAPPPPQLPPVQSPYPVNENPFEKVDLPDVGADLTDEDKIYLATKWGRLYTAEDWVALEKIWSDYERSFDLHNADLINGTKQLCKLDLKGNQSLDTGDIDAYSKIARASDALRKSLKFTEAQRKEDYSSDFSCYGLLVSFAERNNPEDYIRPIDLGVERDIVDKDIKIIKNYTKTLIEDDPAVFKLIEQYIKKREALAENEADRAASEDGIYRLKDKDFKDFNDAVEEQQNIDNTFVEEGVDKN